MVCHYCHKYAFYFACLENNSSISPSRTLSHLIQVCSHTLSRRVRRVHPSVFSHSIWDRSKTGSVSQERSFPAEMMSVLDQSHTGIQYPSFSSTPYLTDLTPRRIPDDALENAVRVLKPPPVLNSSIGSVPTLLGTGNTSSTPIFHFSCARFPYS